MILIFYNLDSTAFVKQKIIPEKKIVSISQAESHVENLNNIMEVRKTHMYCIQKMKLKKPLFYSHFLMYYIQSLKMYASKAEHEHEQVSSHFKNMKSQIEKQEEILDKNLVEINNLKAKVNEAELNSVQQNKVIETLGQELEKNKQQLFNAENKFAGITKQLRSSVSSESANELQVIAFRIL